VQADSHDGLHFICTSIYIRFCFDFFWTKFNSCLNQFEAILEHQLPLLTIDFLCMCTKIAIFTSVCSSFL
jgi:hypothetical protein